MTQWQLDKIVYYTLLWFAFWGLLVKVTNDKWGWLKKVRKRLEK